MPGQTAIVTLTAIVTVVASATADASRLPTVINGAPVEVWTFLPEGPDETLLVTPCDGCPLIPQAEAEDPSYDWSSYPYPPEGAHWPMMDEPAPPFRLKLPEHDPVQDPPSTSEPSS